MVTRITVFVFGMFTGVLSIILFVVRTPMHQDMPSCISDTMYS